MGSSWWWRRPLLQLIMCMTLQSTLPVSRCCFAEERAALMEIHASLVKANSTEPPPPWGKGKAGDDCCLWKGVRCGNATGRVTHLDLHQVVYFGYRDSGAWSLDTTIFAIFTELQFLDLSWNKPVLLSFDGFKPLTNLRQLHLGSNNISGYLPSLLLSVPPQIEVLDLSANMIQGPIPISSSSSNRHNLLSYDGFKSLHNLRKLDLSVNNISGNLPSFLFSLPHIQLLDLSSNRIEGPIPISSSSNLSLSLRSIFLGNNNLNAMLSFFWLKNLNNLVDIDLSWNSNLVVKVNIPRWMPRFQLKSLSLSGCDLDKDIIEKPTFLGTQLRLEYLDLSNNNLSGSMPNWLFTKGSTLSDLNLQNNSLTGSLFPIWHTQTSLDYIDISMNHIAGQLPPNISSMFPSLTTMKISNNNLSGEIPMSFCHISHIDTLDLSNNKFSGDMPPCMFTDLPNLWFLSVSNNYLGGPIFGGRSNLSIGFAMHLDHNNFEGTLPRNLSGELSLMDLRDNKLTGELDASSWDLSALRFLDAADNYMTGEIPSQICALPMIGYLDLSNNHFTGRMMMSCNSTSLGSLNVSMNLLSGDVSWDTSNLLILDARYNMLTGNLNWVHRLPSITVLSLGHNEFHGQIPPGICELRYLRVMDLSHNELSGPVPPCIGAISSFEGIFEEPFMTDGLRYTYVTTEGTKGGFTFDTKGMQLTYGPFINLMLGIDLSGNLLSGGIPEELGKLSYIKSLNLSRNALGGPILTSLANMSQVESLDLSHNELTGVIPMELTRLRSLEVFSVAYNRLSGCVPSSGQFGTFNADSYEGNSDLRVDCSSSSSPTGLELGPAVSPVREDAGPFIAGAASFVLAFWATLAFLFCHPMGRQMLLKL